MISILHQTGRHCNRGLTCRNSRTHCENEKEEEHSERQRDTEWRIREKEGAENVLIHNRDEHCTLVRGSRCLCVMSRAMRIRETSWIAFASTN
ncbi:unnamed protein product [Calypogeia fissa]